ncbi:DUF3078 domain-containing protein [Plebeiibacterium marinum]|uniref:DUF3078 domain-containing protein n=1 Tax=Plebeiibacterium marinum TaxID=2992111 RepID=A0AAE3MDL8_9BACT|nr:DUF3078 domain-containing protein [Plebeiobacterium marinum]MCW3805647.1 DUF3078 domain-containing protein [Plebeiobacterium marinum]
MMKIVLIAFLCALTTGVFAQQEKNDSIKYWKVGGSASLNFSQVSLTNWSGGGNNTVAGTFLFKGFLNYKKEKLAWDNTLDLGYGLTKQGDYKVAKSEDRLYVSSKLGYENGNHWFYTALADFKTQFTVGYKDPLVQATKISDFMSPAYLQFSLGMDYKPSDNFSMFISPLASKMTFVSSDSLSYAGAYGMEKEEYDHMRGEYGASVKVVAQKKDLIKNVNVYSRLDLFSNYSENPQNVDVDFEIGFDMKVNKFLSAVFKTNIIYDDDIKYVNSAGVEEGARIQMKQLFGAGLTYSF